MFDGARMAIHAVESLTVTEFWNQVIGSVEMEDGFPIPETWSFDVTSKKTSIELSDKLITTLFDGGETFMWRFMMRRDTSVCSTSERLRGVIMFRVSDDIITSYKFEHGQSLLTTGSLFFFQVLMTYYFHLPFDRDLSTIRTCIYTVHILQLRRGSEHEIICRTREAPGRVCIHVKKNKINNTNISSS